MTTKRWIIPILFLCRVLNAAETESGADVTRAIEDKKMALEEREKNLDEQERRIKEREEALDKKLVEIERMRAAVSGELASQHKDSEERVTKMVTVFESMTPKSASGVLETLDDWLAVEVLKRMDVKKVAKIMNILDKNRSAKLSELLTGYYHPEAHVAAQKPVQENRALASQGPAEGQGPKTGSAAAVPNANKKGGEK